MKAAPVLFGLVALLAWEGAVRLAGVPPYILPGPLAIVRAFAASPRSLLQALGSTLSVTAMALVVAAVLGTALALAMSASRLARAAIQPWAVALQVTPIVAIVPLVIIWVGHVVSSPQLATATVLVVSAAIVAFFPVFANTAAGLSSAPAELVDLFRLYGGNRWQTLWLLRLPSALPFFLAGLRISGGLALVGAVVAEFVAGSGGIASGLAYTIQEAGFRLQVPRMFAALTLLAGAGVAINAGLGALERVLLRRRALDWQFSARRPGCGAKRRTDIP